MNIKEKATNLRKQLKKELGFNSRQISVRRKGNSINVEIKTTEAIPAQVQDIADKYEEISRCFVTGEILSGGNHYVDVEVNLDTKVEFGELLMEQVMDAIATNVENETYGEIIRVNDEWLVNLESRDYWTATHEPSGNKVNLGRNYCPESAGAMAYVELNHKYRKWSSSDDGAEFEFKPSWACDDIETEFSNHSTSVEAVFDTGVKSEDMSINDLITSYYPDRELDQLKALDFQIKMAQEHQEKLRQKISVQLHRIAEGIEKKCLEVDAVVSSGDVKVPFAVTQVLASDKMYMATGEVQITMFCYYGEGRVLYGNLSVEQANTLADFIKSGVVAEDYLKQINFL